VKIQILGVSLAMSVIVGAIQNNPLPLISGASALGLGYAVGFCREDKTKREREVSQLSARETQERCSVECEQRLEHQRTRLESIANQNLMQAVRIESERLDQIWRSRLDKERLDALKIKRELEALQAEMIKGDRRHQATIVSLDDRHEMAIQVIKTQSEQKIEELTDRLDQALSQLSEYKKRESQIKRAEDRITEFKSNEKLIRHQLQQMQLEGQKTERTIATLQRELSSLQDQAVANYNEGLQIGFEKGVKETKASYSAEIDRYSLKIARLETEIEKLEVKLSIKRKSEKFDQNLPTLSEVVGLPKPLLVCGSQGSGKALTLANAIASFTNGEPCLPVVLDVSEGNDPDSSWHRLGVPVTDNPLVFLNFLETLVNRLESRAHRNNREAYAAQPWIFVVVDEAICAFDSLDKDAIESRLTPCLRAIESRGAKRKVIPALLTQNRQIQNISTKGVKIWNSGVLSNFTHILLNDAFTSAVTKDDLEMHPDLGEYLEIFKNHFVSCLEQNTSRGRVKTPIKHPSHHGQLLGDTTPKSGITEIPLADPYDWFPREIKRLFAIANGDDHPVTHWEDRGGDRVTPQITPPLEPLPDKPGEVSTSSRSPYDIGKDLGLELGDVNSILDGLEQNLSLTKVCTEAINTTKNSKKYKAARELFLSLKG